MPIPLQTMWRVITLRFTREDLQVLDWKHLGLGLFTTWIVGMGRYWDNPRVELPQHLGLGSLAYVFILSLWLYVVVWPLRPRDWSYRHLLVFVTLTSAPAVIYAIPVEKFMTIGRARNVNLAFLGCVATWRVVMYSLYLRRWAGLTRSYQFCATLLPLSIIVVALAMLNLDRAVFAVMAGIDQQPTADDGAYFALIALSTMTIWSAPLILLIYTFAVAARWFDRHKGGQ